MSQEPWTLFWPRSGFTPTPSRPMLPVTMARLAMPITIVEPWRVLGDAEAVVDRAVARRSAKSRAAARSSSGSMPVASAIASGEFAGSAMKAR